VIFKAEHPHQNNFAQRSKDVKQRIEERLSTGSMTGAEVFGAVPVESNLEINDSMFVLLFISVKF
jgi:hypothetical protein